MGYTKEQREANRKRIEALSRTFSRTENQEHTMEQDTKETPRYRLTEKCYLDGIFYDPEAQPLDRDTDEPKPLIIKWNKTPEYYMVPMNDAARAMVAKHPGRDQAVNAIDRLTTVTGPNRAV